MVVVEVVVVVMLVPQVVTHFVVAVFNSFSKLEALFFIVLVI